MRENLRRSSAANSPTPSANRRARLRGRENITKRYLAHVAGFNLSLVLRKLLGFGTPRGYDGARKGLLAAPFPLWAFIRAMSAALVCQRDIRRSADPMPLGDILPRAWWNAGLPEPFSSTGC